MFNFPAKYEIKGSYVVIKEVEVCSAVVYHGSIQYLTHAQRVEIIKGNGEDYDIPPSNFAGPMTKEITSDKWEAPHAPFFIITEWDGTKQLVHAVRDYGRGSEFGDMVITYDDGVQHCINEGYFKELRGLEPDEGYINPASAMLSVALQKAADAVRKYISDHTEGACSEWPEPDLWF